MATIIRVPALGIAIANISIIAWLIKEGESVTQGQTLLEVQTDKLSMDVPAERSGVLRKVFFGEGADIKDGQPLAIIGEADENIDPLVLQANAELNGGPAQATSVQSPVVTEQTEALRKVLATPLAKRIAKEKGVDLALVHGTGPGGRITEQDVNQYAEQQASAPTVDEVEIIPLKGARKALADHMVESVRVSPHYTMSAEIDCTRLVALRERLKDEFKQQYGLNLTYVPFVVKAMALAVPHVPIVNSTVRDGNIVVYKVAHVGVAVAADNLIHVPVIRNPCAKSILEITRELARYTELARKGGLAPRDVSGGTITVTNMGVADLSIRGGTAIIHQPQCAILTMGRVMKRVVVVGDEDVGIRPMMDVSFTYDHRVVMGVPGAMYAEAVKRCLEDPEGLVAGTRA